MLKCCLVNISKWSVSSVNESLMLLPGPRAAKQNFQEKFVYFVWGRSACLWDIFKDTGSPERHSPLMTKPNVLPSLCSVTSTFLNMTPDPWTAEGGRKQGSKFCQEFNGWAEYLSKHQMQFMFRSHWKHEETQCKTEVIQLPRLIGWHTNPHCPCETLDVQFFFRKWKQHYFFKWIKTMLPKVTGMF